MPGARLAIPNCRRALLAIVTAAAAVSVAVAAAHATELPLLVDQFGAPAGLEAGIGEVQVVIVVSARRLRRIKPWEKALRREFPDLPVLRVADVPRSSPTDYDRVAKKLRRRLPENLPVAIDLQGEWASILELDTRVPNILIFDADGELTYRQSGMYRKSLYPPLQAALIEARSMQRVAAAPTPIAF
ncbi:MAG: TlpA family protein disulfide reductase [Gammaproteobacteria bacterium]